MLLMLLGIAALSFSRGFKTSLQYEAEGYWFINYGNGLIRRGLLGQIFQDQSDLNKVLSSALYVHLGACSLLLFGLWGWFRTVLDRGIEALLLPIFAIFAASQFVATLAYDAGFLDVYDYLLVLAAAIAILCDFWALAGAIGFIGPFIHESFLFVWPSFSFFGGHGAVDFSETNYRTDSSPSCSSGIHGNHPLRSDDTRRHRGDGRCTTPAGV